MATTIAVLSQKGGTGKTTTVRSLADIFSRLGLDVLAVDLDPQGNLSSYFEIPIGASPTIADVLTFRATAERAVHGPLIPANQSLAAAELELQGSRHATLKTRLGDVTRLYDVVLIDCPPSRGLLAINALVAADHALVTTNAQYFSLQGVEQMLDMIELTCEDLNPRLTWLGVVMNIADLRTLHSREVLATLRESFGPKVFETVIRQSIRYAESAQHGTPIIEYSPRVGADYLALADELLHRLGMPAGRRKLRGLRGELVPA